MAISIRMHFDGKVFIPEEPVEVPVNEPLRAEVSVITSEDKVAEIARRRAAWKRAGSRAVKGANVPLESLRRENMYEPPRGL